MIAQLFIRLFGNQDKDNLQQLIRTAYKEEKITQTDVEYLSKTLNEFDIDPEDIFHTQDDSTALRASLPFQNYQKFKLIYILTREMISNGGLSDQKLDIISQVTAVFLHESKRAKDLINSVVSNIHNGNSVKDSYSRLGYLLKPRQINFN
ncbi:MAG: hypothetical protein RJQ09_08965 [Cyclobacteriaceae bacterium]